MGAAIFDEAVQSTFGHRRRISGPVQLLPFVFRRGAVTTNFDYVLNEVYNTAGNRFSLELVAFLRLSETGRAMRAMAAIRHFSRRCRAGVCTPSFHSSIK